MAEHEIAMQVTQAWDSAMSSALLGTEHQPFILDPAGPGIDWLLHAISTSPPERQVLAAAGLIALLRRAGRTLAADTETSGSVAADDDLPRCGTRSKEHLRLMLDREYESALPEWLIAATQDGKRVPEEYLPELLELGNLRSSQRILLLPVLGERGRWLAAQNADWYFAAERDADAVWQTGEQDERLFLLKRLRITNPGRARELMASTWQQESAQDRTGFLATLLNGLSMADEPFLEAALDDRSKEARRTAAELLARLEGSALVQRMIERAQLLLSLEPQSDHIEVTFPAEVTKAMLRDGIEPRPPAIVKRMGAQAWQLMQILGAVPPGYWCRAWKRSISAILQASNPSEWRLALLEGWALAAQRHNDIGWARALLALWPTADSVMEGLLAALGQNEREGYALQLLQSNVGPLLHHPALPVLQACTHTWNPDLSLAVLDRFRQTIQASENRFTDSELRSILASFAEYMSPEVLGVATTSWPADAPAWPQWQKTVEEFLSMLQFRHDMLEALQESEPR